MLIYPFLCAQKHYRAGTVKTTEPRKRLARARTFEPWQRRQNAEAHHPYADCNATSSPYIS
jgi:hypothetical protein